MQRFADLAHIYKEMKQFVDTLNKQLPKIFESAEYQARTLTTHTTPAEHRA